MKLDELIQRQEKVISELSKEISYCEKYGKPVTAMCLNNALKDATTVLDALETMRKEAA